MNIIKLIIIRGLKRICQGLKLIFDKQKLRQQERGERKQNIKFNKENNKERETEESSKTYSLSVQALHIYRQQSRFYDRLKLLYYYNINHPDVSQYSPLDDIIIIYLKVSTNKNSKSKQNIFYDLLDLKYYNLLDLIIFGCA